MARRISAASARDSPSGSSPPASGFRDEFFKGNVEEVKHLRDAYDVVHYSLVPRHEELEKALLFASDTAGAVLRAYRRSLA